MRRFEEIIIGEMEFQHLYARHERQLLHKYAILLQSIWRGRHARIKRGWKRFRHAVKKVSRQASACLCVALCVCPSSAPQHPFVVVR